MNSLFPLKVRVVRRVAEAFLREHQNDVENYLKETARRRSRYRWWHLFDCPVSRIIRYDKELARLRRSIVDDPLSHPGRLYFGRSTAETLLEATDMLDPEAVTYLDATDACFLAEHGHLSTTPL